MGIEIARRSFQKKVIDGIYETNKILLKIGHDNVTKLFKPKSTTRRRYRTEKEALSRLRGIPGVPQLIHSDDNTYTLEMSRLPGESASQLSEGNLIDLAWIVERILDAGVARHSMPIRDIVIDQRGRIGLVDFERATLRPRWWRPDWPVAKLVFRYHLYRLISEHQPQMLDATQRNIVNLGKRLRGFVTYIHS